MILHAMSTTTQLGGMGPTQYRYEPKDIAAYMGTISKMRTISVHMRRVSRITWNGLTSLLAFLQHGETY